MKKSPTPPDTVVVIIVVLIGAIVALAVPFIKGFLESPDRQARETPPPDTVKTPEPAPVPQEPRPAPVPKEKPKPPPPPKVTKPEKPAPPADTAEKARAELETKIADLYPLPDIRPLEEIVDNWNNVPERAYPKSVTIDQSLDFHLYHQGQVIGGRKIPAGAHVVPVGLKESILIVAPDVQTSMRAEIPVDETNFKQLIQLRYDDFFRKQTRRVEEQRARELARVLKQQAHEAALADYNDGSDPRFDPMKESLRKGEAGTFEFENATQWRWLGSESIDGVEYDVGLAVFETESAFGVARTEIKALIRDGNVDKWIDPASGEEI